MSNEATIRKRSRSLIEGDNDSVVIKEGFEGWRFFDNAYLPREVVIAILLCLPVLDFFRASRVCKKWKDLIWSVMGSRSLLSPVARRFTRVIGQEFVNRRLRFSTFNRTHIRLMLDKSLYELTPSGRAALEKEAAFIKMREFSTEYGFYNALQDQNIPRDILQWQCDRYMDPKPLYRYNMQDADLFQVASVVFKKDGSVMRKWGKNYCVLKKNKCTFCDRPKIRVAMAFKVYDCDTMLPRKTKKLTNIKVCSDIVCVMLQQMVACFARDCNDDDCDCNEHHPRLETLKSTIFYPVYEMLQRERAQ